MTIFEELKKKFDKIYLLTLSNRTDRKNAVLEQLKNIGLEDEHDINIQYATPFPHNDIIIDAFNKSGRGRFTKPNEFDCARNHYSIVRQAYDDPNCNSVLIIEDDIQFLKDVELFSRYLDNIPEKYDILQFGGFTADQNLEILLENRYPEKTYPNMLWLEHTLIGVWTTSMYALSKRGMMFYLKYMDKFFWVADGPLYHAASLQNSKIVKAYVSRIPLIIQADKDIINSDIRDKSNDDIDYNNQNIYEKNINRSDYYEYKVEK